MKKIHTLVIASLLVVFLIPNLVFASWWNPFTWFSHTKTETPHISDPEPKTAGSNPVLKSEPVPKSTTAQNTPVVKKTPPVTPQVQTAVAPTVTVTPPTVITPPVDPRKIAIDQVLQNPTFDNFKNFCNQAKSLEGAGATTQLNASRQSLVSVSNSLYANINGCKFLDSGEDFVVLTLPDSSLALPLKDDDTDAIRQLRITYNNKLATLSQTTKFVIFVNPFYGSKNPPVADQHSPTQSAEYALMRLATSSKSMFWRSMVTDAFYDPVAQLRNFSF